MRHPFKIFAIGTCFFTFSMSAFSVTNELDERDKFETAFESLIQEGSVASYYVQTATEKHSVWHYSRFAESRLLMLAQATCSGGYGACGNFCSPIEGEDFSCDEPERPCYTAAGDCFCVGFPECPNPSVELTKKAMQSVLSEAKVDHVQPQNMVPIDAKARYGNSKCIKFTGEGPSIVIIQNLCAKPMAGAVLWITDEQREKVTYRLGGNSSANSKRDVMRRGKIAVVFNETVAELEGANIASKGAHQVERGEFKGIRNLSNDYLFVEWQLVNNESHAILNRGRDLIAPAHILMLDIDAPNSQLLLIGSETEPE